MNQSFMYSYKNPYKIQSGWQTLRYFPDSIFFAVRANVNVFWSSVNPLTRVFSIISNWWNFIFYWIEVLMCVVISYQLLIDFTLTAYWLHVNCLLTLDQLFIDFISTACWLYVSFLNRFLKSVLPLLSTWSCLFIYWRRMPLALRDQFFARF